LASVAPKPNQSHPRTRTWKTGLLPLPDFSTSRAQLVANQPSAAPAISGRGLISHQPAVLFSHNKATSPQYSSLRTKQPSTTSQPNRLKLAGKSNHAWELEHAFLFFKKKIELAFLGRVSNLDKKES
jgi:hypothetical protein